MGTPFSDIYLLFLSQIKDYELATMEETLLEENLQLWLINSIGYFTLCKKDLRNYDSDLAQFTDVLDSIEKQILAKFMVHSYLNTFLLTEQNLKQALNSKDYRMYSPANQLKALKEVREQINSEANTLMSRYSYNIHDVKRFFK
ncbi:hypothetical protein [Sporosarcina sp. FSL W7-1283]|uniref:hypothetical protein n=1 Tax=Sporosarcina sp. FSL W7-1283 TaxID=2921560 RepID=UPI0030F97992